MKWHAFVVAALIGGLASAQTPPAPAGGIKPTTKPSSKTSNEESKSQPKSKSKSTSTRTPTDRISERANNMRKQIARGRLVKSHVKVVVRLKNGNRLRGVVKDGRLVERVDGLRFVDANARDRGAGIRLWYTGGTRSYIFVPFHSLNTYEVVQRLSNRQLMEIEKELQMAEKRAAERKAKREAKARREARGKAQGDLPDPAGQQPGGQPGQDPNRPMSPLDRLRGTTPASRLPTVPRQMPGTTPMGATQQPATGGVGGEQTAKATTSPTANSKSGAKSRSIQAKGGGKGKDKDIEEVKQELVWAQLLNKYPPAAGWNEAKKGEISRRFQVIGVKPSKNELEFVEKFDEWLKACKANKIDPNQAIEKKPQTKREKRIAERKRLRRR